MSDARKERCTFVASGCFKLGMPALPLTRCVSHRVQTYVQRMESEFRGTQQLKYAWFEPDWRPR